MIARNATVNCWVYHFLWPCWNDTNFLVGGNQRGGDKLALKCFKDEFKGFSRRIENSSLSFLEECGCVGRLTEIGSPSFNERLCESSNGEKVCIFRVFLCLNEVFPRNLSSKVATWNNRLRHREAISRVFRIFTYKSAMVREFSSSEMQSRERKSVWIPSLTMIMQNIKISIDSSSFKLILLINSDWNCLLFVNSIRKQDKIENQFRFLLRNPVNRVTSVSPI